MDFSYSEEQEAVRELSVRIFTDQATHERLKELEADADEHGPFDRQLWGELAGAGLLGIALGEDVGGSGLDFVAACLVVEAAGRTAAHVPVVEHLVYGAAAIDRFGTPEQRALLLPGAAAGTTVLTAALAEAAGDVVVPAVTAPLTTAALTPDGGWRLNGTKACVPAGLLADFVLVPASLRDAEGQPAGSAVFVVATDATGVRRTAQQGAARPEAIIELDGVEVADGDRLGGDGAAVATWIAEHATAALCIEEGGACASALTLAAEYTKTREQFGKPIATFQAVGQRVADAYVDAEAVRLTAWQAAWRLSAGLPATAEVAMAKFWAADGGQRVVHAAAHVHGGVGVDRDYPLHRFFLLTEQIELTLGGATESLLVLGGLLASAPA